MPNLKWSDLTSLQLGKYAEYYAKMEFASYGYEVYTAEVDDHGVDFVCKKSNSLDFYEVQVKSFFKTNYVYIPKSKMETLDTHRLVCLLRFEEGNLPEVYIIPAPVWKNPNAVFVDKSHYHKPEWGINFSQKNKHLLDKFKAENYF